MTWYFPQSATSASTIITLTSNDGATILPNVTLVSTVSNTINVTGGNNRVEVYGAVANSAFGGTAIQLGDSTTLDSGNRLSIAASGMVTNPNNGTTVFIQGKDFALDNAGLILGGASANSALSISGDSATGVSTIVNSGTISGINAIVRDNVVINGLTIELTNTGLIDGLDKAYGLSAGPVGAGIDRITNSGFMKGKVLLGDNDDRYDGALGTIIGTVWGGSGNDVIIGGKEKNTFNGDDGNDTLSGGGESDTLSGGNGDDSIAGDDGDDSMAGDAGNDSLSGGAGIDTLGGGDGDDQIKGDDGNDMLAGDAGNDALTGGAGADTLTGGAGADRFVYLAKTDSTGKPGKPDTLDLIADFSTAEDVIDLSAIDANAKRKLDQAFIYIETDRFSGRAGELRSFEKAGETWLQADTDGNRRADLSIRLTGSVDFAADDFIL